MTKLLIFMISDKRDKFGKRTISLAFFQFRTLVPMRATKRLIDNDRHTTFHFAPIISQYIKFWTQNSGWV